MDKPPQFYWLPDREGNTLLHRVCRDADLFQVQKFNLDFKCVDTTALHFKNHANFTPLHYIVKHHGEEWNQLLNLILKNGGYTNSGNDVGDTPLHIAVRSQNFPAVEALIKQQLETEGPVKKLEANKDSETPLQIAIRLSPYCSRFSDKVLEFVGCNFLNKRLENVMINSFDHNFELVGNIHQTGVCEDAILLLMLVFQHSTANIDSSHLDMFWKSDFLKKKKNCIELIKGGKWMPYVIHWLLRRPDFDVNYTYRNGQTLLHIVLHIKNCQDLAKIVLKRQDLIEADTEDDMGITPVQIATEKGLREVEILLMRRSEVKESIESLYRDRQIYVDATNAILIGAALIASVAFSGWLQPPLGYGNGEGKMAMYVAIEGHPCVLSFWITDSLSFLLSMVTMIVGAGGVIPRRNMYIGTAVHHLRNTLTLAAFLLVLSAVFAVAAFASAGFAVLPPILKWKLNLIVTITVGE